MATLAPGDSGFFFLMTTEDCSYDLLYKGWEWKYAEHPSLGSSAKGQREQQPPAHQRM